MPLAYSWFSVMALCQRLVDGLMASLQRTEYNTTQIRTIFFRFWYVDPIKKTEITFGQTKKGQSGAVENLENRALF